MFNYYLLLERLLVFFNDLPLFRLERLLERLLDFFRGERLTRPPPIIALPQQYCRMKYWFFPAMYFSHAVSIRLQIVGICGSI